LPDVTDANPEDLSSLAVELGLVPVLGQIDPSSQVPRRPAGNLSFLITGEACVALKAPNALVDNSAVMHRFEDASLFLYGQSPGLASQCEDSGDAALIVESGLHFASGCRAAERLKEDMRSCICTVCRGVNPRVGTCTESARAS
jgi:hypothetical protein